MEKDKIKTFHVSQTLKESNKNSKNLYPADKNLINVKLPDLKSVSKEKNQKKAKIKSQRSMTLTSKDLTRKSIGNISDYSLDNSIVSKKDDENKSNSNSNLPIMKNNEDYFSISYKKKMTRNHFLQKDDSKSIYYNNSNNSNSNTGRMKKKNRTIINIYNTSVKNSPQIYLLSSLITTSTSLPNSSNNNPKSIKKIKENKKMYLPSMDIVKTNHRNKKNTISKMTLKKRLKMNLKGKDIINYSREKKNNSHLKHKNEIIKKKVNYKDGPDYNEELRNKFINKNIKNNCDFKIFIKKNNYISNILDEKISIIKNLIIDNKKENEKEKKEDLPLNSILHNYYLEIFNLKKLKFLKKFENYIFLKYIKKSKHILINNIPQSMPNILLNNYFEFDIYSYISNRDFGLKIYSKFPKINSYESIRSLEKLRHDLKHQENFYFLLERFIKNDLLIEHEDNIKFNIQKHFSTNKREKRNSIFRNSICRKRIKRKYSIYNKIKIPHSILTVNYLKRNKDLIYIDKRVSFIRKFKINLSTNYNLPKRKPKLSIINGYMSKEKMLFRTQEINNKLKQDLNTLEDILFYLIKENSFREFKDIQKRFQISLESKNNTNDTFLIYASKCEKIDFVEYLIEKGAFINAQNNELNTPLHYALKNRNFKISDLLLKAGANEKLVNKANLTPWQFMNNYDM